MTPEQINPTRMQCVVRNCHQLLRKRYHGEPLWCMVVDVFGFGSSSAVQFCKDLGFDPHQSLAAKELKKES
jgi:hypothetical protein